MESVERGRQATVPGVWVWVRLCVCARVRVTHACAGYGIQMHSACCSTS